MATTAEQQQLTEVLLEDIYETAFPSAVQLDRVERLISSRDELETYIRILTQKVEDANFSPGHLLDRIERLLRVLQRVDQEDAAGST